MVCVSLMFEAPFVAPPTNALTASASGSRVPARHWNSIMFEPDYTVQRAAAAEAEASEKPRALLAHAVALAFLITILFMVLIQVCLFHVCLISNGMTPPLW